MKTDLLLPELISFQKGTINKRQTFCSVFSVSISSLQLINLTSQFIRHGISIKVLLVVVVGCGTCWHQSNEILNCIKEVTGFHDLQEDNFQWFESYIITIILIISINSGYGFIKDMDIIGNTIYRIHTTVVQNVRIRTCHLRIRKRVKCCYGVFCMAPIIRLINLCVWLLFGWINIVVFKTEWWKRFSFLCNTHELEFNETERRFLSNCLVSILFAFLVC